MEPNTPAEQSPTVATETPASETTLAPTQSLDAGAQHDQLAQLLANPEWTPEETAKPAIDVVTEVVPAGGQPQETATEAAPTETATEATPETQTEDNPLPQGIERPRLHDPQDQVIAALKKSRPDLTWGECEARVKGAPAKAEVATTEATPDQLTTWQQELADVDQQLADAGAEGALMDAGMIALLQKRSDLAADIKTEAKLRERDAQFTQQQATAEAQARTAKQSEAVTLATQRFPLLTTPGSPLRAEADRLIAIHEGSAFLKQPNAPIDLAEQAAVNVARALSKANGTAFEVELAKLDKATTAPKAPAVVPKPAAVPKKVIPASGAQATQRPDQPATEQEQFGGSLSNPREEHERLNKLLYGT